MSVLQLPSLYTLPKTALLPCCEGQVKGVMHASSNFMGMGVWHLLRSAAAGNGTAGVASAVFKAADYSPPLASGTFTLRAVFDPPYGAWQCCASN